MQFITVNEAIDKIGFGRFHWFLICLSGLGFGTLISLIIVYVAGATVELIMISLIKTQLGKHYGIDGNFVLMGMLTSICFVGELIGGIGWSFVSDKIGRRLTFVSSALVTSVFAVLGMLAPNYYTFLLCRLGLGFGLGGSMSIDFIYFVEFAPRSGRMTRTVAIIYLGILALVYTALGGYLLLPAKWIWFMGYSAIPMILLTAIRLCVPWETPLFLYSQGKYEECKQMLKTIARINGSPFGKEDYVLISEISAHPASQINGKEPVPWRLTFTFSIVFLLQTLTYYGLTLWLHQIAVKKGIPRYSPSVNLIAMAAFEVFGVMLTQKLLSKYGNSIKPALLMNFGGALLSMGLLQLLGRSQLTFTLISSLAYFFIVGVWTVIYVLGPQLFAVPVRARLFGLCACGGKVGGILGPILTGGIFQNQSQAGSWDTMLLVIACYVLAMVATLLIKQQHV